MGPNGAYQSMVNRYSIIAELENSKKSIDEIAQTEE